MLSRLPSLITLCIIIAMVSYSLNTHPYSQYIPNPHFSMDLHPDFQILFHCLLSRWSKQVFKRGGGMKMHFFKHVPCPVFFISFNHSIIYYIVVQTSIIRIIFSLLNFLYPSLSTWSLKFISKGVLYLFLPLKYTAQSTYPVSLF